jgi:hypothetical protein
MNPRSLIMLSVLVLLVTTLACGLPAASTSQSPTATVAPSIPATDTPTSIPLAGSITGHLSYPSEYIPTLKVVAFDVTNLSVYNFVSTEMNQSEYVLQVPPGTYYIVS